MAYTKQTWECGDIVTAEKLNHMEDGIENAQLPSVTSDDNGDVLAVVNGAWAKAQPSGGGGAFDIQVSVSHDEMGYHIVYSDKTFDEILQAIQTGMNVRMFVQGYSNTLIPILTPSLLSYYNQNITLIELVGAISGSPVYASIQRAGLSYWYFYV